MAAGPTYFKAQADKTFLRILVYTAGAYPARPAAANVPAGYARYIGPTQPTDWLTNDEWVNNS